MKSARTGSRWHNRPDGTLKEYYSLCDWPKKRVVWEFIRRNLKYQKACDQAVMEQRTDDLDGPPSDYGVAVPLKNLVDYTRDWEEAEPIIYFSASVSAESIPEGKGDPAHFVKVVLDVRKLVRHPWMLQVRLSEIERKARKKMETYAKESRREIIVPRFHAEAVARSLRYLDMVTAKASTRQIKNVLYPGKSSDDQDRMLDKDKKRAKKYTSGHVAFLLLEELADGSAKAVPTAKTAALPAGTVL